MHGSYVLVKHFVSLELYNVCLRTTVLIMKHFLHLLGHKWHLPLKVRPSALFWVFFLTHYPFGGFICFSTFSLVSSISAVVKRSVAIWNASSLWKNVRHNFQSFFPMKINSEPDTATVRGFHLIIFLYKQYQIWLKHDLPCSWCLTTLELQCPDVLFSN